MNGLALELVPAQGTLPVLSVENSEKTVEPQERKSIPGWLRRICQS